MLTTIQREHLRLIQQKEGNLNPKEVLRDARNPNSPLHQLFEWDDSVAAEAYRLMQAKQVVRYVVRVVPQPRREPTRVTVAPRAVERPASVAATAKEKTERDYLVEATIAQGIAYVAAEVARRAEVYWSEKHIPYPAGLSDEMMFIDKYLRGVPVSNIIEVQHEIADEEDGLWDDARAQAAIQKYNLRRPPGWDEVRALKDYKADKVGEDWIIYGLPPYTPPALKPHFPGDDRPQGGTMRRFSAAPHNDALTHKTDVALRSDHPALTEARTIFPTTVRDPSDADHVLIPGHNSPKIGDYVAKGPWAGMNIFTLTLEERATCPDSCDLLKECYGNGMPLAKRWKYGPELVAKLDEELRALGSLHPAGFVVRLHILGDFPDIEYVRYWIGWMADIPQIHVFGYTAHGRYSLVGQEIAEINKAHAERWAIRFSVAPDTEPLPMQATTIWRKDRGAVDEGVVCPASSEDTDCCGTCGLCWNPEFSGKRVVFLGHGMNRTKGGRPAEDREINPELSRVVAPLPAPKLEPEIDLKVNVTPASRRFTPPTKGSFPTDDAIARFIAEKGVKKLPPAMAAPTTVDLPKEALTELTAHENAMQEAFAAARKRKWAK